MLGCDEHTPGNKEGSDNRRKNMALVFTFNFVELGPDVLECDASWYVPVIASAQVFKKLPGGWSAAMLRAILRQLLIGPGRFSCAGVLVPIEINPRFGKLQLVAWRAMRSIGRSGRSYLKNSP